MCLLGVKRIPSEIIVHQLNVNKNARPVKQKQLSFRPESNKIINEEFDNLLDTSIIKEVMYPTWLANPILMKKLDHT